MPRVAILALLLLSSMGTAASAHVPTTDGTSTIRQDGSGISYRLELDYDTLTKATGLGTLPNGTPDAEREAFLEAHRGEVSSYLSERLVVDLDGEHCPAELGSMGVATRQQFLFARLELSYRCASATGQFTVRYDVFAETQALGAEHSNIVDYELGGVEGSDVFEGDYRELRVGDRSSGSGFVSAMSRFVGHGLEHILLGIDHVLFLVLLLLGARNWRSVLRLATAFTVAHSVTLALAVLGWVDVPAGIVEPLIALSIVYVAVENIVRGETRHRLVVVFGFGLLHGLGFAGAMSFTDHFGSRLVAALLSFNLGIELGQLAVVLLVFPLLQLARRFAWSSFAQAGAAALVGVVGLLWLIERLPAPIGAA